MQNDVFIDENKSRNKRSLVEYIVLGTFISSVFGLVYELKKINVESIGEYFENRIDFNSKQVEIGKELFKKYKDISDYRYNMVLSSLNYLPVKLLNTLKDSGLDGIISDGSIMEYAKDIGYEILIDDRLGINTKDIQACYMHWHHIFISSKFEDLLSFNLNLIHEIGHAYDYLKYSDTNEILSQQEDFMSIYNLNEKEDLFNYNDYYIKSEREYFAESFSLYYINPTYLKDKAPHTYKYFKNILSNYEK